MRRNEVGLGGILLAGGSAWTITWGILVASAHRGMSRPFFIAATYVFLTVLVVGGTVLVLAYLPGPDRRSNARRPPWPQASSQADCNPRSFLIQINPILGWSEPERSSPLGSDFGSALGDLPGAAPQDYLLARVCPEKYLGSSG